MPIDVNGKSYETDEEGYLVNLAEWNEDIGKELAKSENVEMTENLVRDWLRGGAREIEASRESPGVQAPEQIERDLTRRLGALHAVADRIYDRWTAGLSLGS